MKTSKSQLSTGGLMALLALAVIYALFGVVARYLGKGLGLYEQWYLRYGAAFLLAATLFHRQISWRKFLHLSAHEWQVLLFRALIGQVVAVGFFTLAAERTQIGLLTFMEALPASSILGILVFHENVSWQRAGLIAFSFLGAILILFNSGHDLTSFNVGAFFALISTALFAFMLVGRRWHNDELNNPEMTVAILGIVTVATYLICPVLYHRWFIPVSHWTANFSTIMVLAGCLSVGSVYLANYGFEHVSAVIAGNILMLEVFFGPLFGFLFYHEVLTVRDVGGGLIILLSVIAMNQVARREHAPAQIAVAPD